MPGRPSLNLEEPATRRANLDARAQAFLDRIAPLSADLAAHERTRALALKKLRRICQAEVRRLKTKHKTVLPLQVPRRHPPNRPKPSGPAR
jgi:hypothetical protein